MSAAGSSGPVKKCSGRDRAGPATFFPGLGRDRDWVLTQKIRKKGKKIAKKRKNYEKKLIPGKGRDRAIAKTPGPGRDYN